MFYAFGLAKSKMAAFNRQEKLAFQCLYRDMPSEEHFDLLPSEYEEEQKDLKMRIAELDDLIENGETQTKDLKQQLRTIVSPCTVDTKVRRKPDKRQKAA